ncbi:inositol monophosphatase [Shimia sp. R9_1]|uniref:inositol monophosphatase family protein n=1 Tax=Shimia sp. R9_1 TaxID=2821111 RepID=UPI001ADB8D54|nr:inositol monophosphatase family protein [Shimia sp. R9_1]MBO9409749.1 inositol monophosphatase [Shimia sp. R9_1]
MTNTYETRLAFAKDIAWEAGSLAQKLYQERDAGFVAVKGLQDFVTLADRRVEELIRSEIAVHFPNDAVLGEEDGFSGNSECVWVVDPIDGTANYMRGLPDWAVSIACCFGDEIRLGVIYAPKRDEMCWAEAGKGCFRNVAPANVSDCTRRDEALILLGRSGRASLQDYLNLVERIVESGMEYRRNGSAAVSLMDLAIGRAEGFHESHLNAWDALAGVLLVREAGGNVSCAQVPTFLERGGKVLAAAPQFEARLANVVASESNLARSR